MKKWLSIPSDEKSADETNVLAIPDLIEKIGIFEDGLGLASHLLVNKQSMAILMPIFSKRLIAEWQGLLFYKRVVWSSGALEEKLANDTLYFHLNENLQLNVIIGADNRLISQAETVDLKKIVGENKLVDFFEFKESSIEITNFLKIKEIMSILRLAPFLNFISFNLLKNKDFPQIPQILKENKEVTNDILRKSFQRRLFYLIHFLFIKRVSLNNFIMQTKAYSSYESTGYYHHGEIIGERGGHYVTKYYDAKVCATDELFNDSELDLEMILFAVRRGAIFENYQWGKIITQSLEILEEKESPLFNFSIAHELLMKAYNLEHILSSKDLEKILALRSCGRINNLFIVAVEALYLLQKLEFIKSPWYDFSSDKRDVPVINSALKSLKPLTNKVTTLDVDRLEQIKLNLWLQAKKLPEQPGPVYNLLNKLMKSKIIFIHGMISSSQKMSELRSATLEG